MQNSEVSMPVDYDGGESVPEIETSVECPSCGKFLFLTYQTTNIPYEGNINIQTYYCTECYYKHTNIYPEKDDRPRTITFTTERQEDLSIVVYRSPGGIVRIPEIDVDIYPGDESPGEITTVEGILLTVKDKMEMFIEDSEDRVVADRSLEFLNNILSGRTSAVTVVIEDPSGKSIIHSSRAKIEFIA